MNRPPARGPEPTVDDSAGTIVDRAEAEGTVTCGPPELPVTSAGDTLTSGTPPVQVGTFHGPRPAGEAIGRFRGAREIAAGGMGVILRGRDPELNRDVAIKVLRAGAAAGRQEVVRFVREARITGQLEHPNIVPVHELAKETDGSAWFAMKLVNGRSLADELYLLRKGEGDPLAVRGRLLDAFRKVCDAVAFAHSRRVIHRDLKPSNVMIGRFGEVLVLDWGIAKILGEDDDVAPDVGERGGADSLVTLEGTLMGTPAYMAPEQAEGAVGRIDPRTDVYSLGAVLYEILTLAPPYGPGNATQVLLDLRKGPPPPPATRSPEARIPRELDAIVRRAMARDPANRYQTVADLEADLEAYLQGWTLPSVRSTVLERASKWVRRNRAVAAASAALTLTVLVSVVWLAVAYRSRGVEVSRRERAEAAAWSERDQAEAARLAFFADLEALRAEKDAAAGFDMSAIAHAAASYRTRPSSAAERTLLDSRAKAARLLWTSPPGSSAVRSVAYSPDRTTLLASNAAGEAVRLDPSTGRAVAGTDLEGVVALAPDGSRALVRDGVELRVREVSSADAGASLGVPVGRPVAVAFSRDASRVAYAVEGSAAVRIHQTSTGALVASIDVTESAITSLSFAARQLVVGTADGVVRPYDIRSGVAAKPLVCPAPSAIHALACCPSGARFVSGSADGVLRFWAGESGVREFVFLGQGGPVRVAAVSSDGRWVISGSDEGRIRFWNSARGRLVSVLEGHRGPITALAWSPDGTSIVSGSSDGTVRLWRRPSTESASEKWPSFARPWLVAPDWTASRGDPAALTALLDRWERDAGRRVDPATGRIVEVGRD